VEGQHKINVMGIAALAFLITFLIKIVKHSCCYMQHVI